MTTEPVGGKIIPQVVLAAFCALCGTLAVAAAQELVSGVFQWLLIFALLAFLAGVCVKLYARWACRPDVIVSELRRICDGGQPARSTEPEALVGFGPELYEQIRLLDESFSSLRLDKARAELVLASMSDGIIALDDEGKITLYNRAAASFFDEKSSRVIGRTLEEVDLHPEITRLAGDCTARREVLASEIRVPGLHERVFSVVATPFRASSAASASALVVLHDLTETRRHERSQREFVGNVSHELRTPITSVRVTAEALLSGAKNDEQLLDRFLATIISEADRLSALIDDLMELAKRDAGTVEAKRTVARVADLVDRAVRVLLPQAKKNEVALDWDVPDELSCRCDEGQMVQVLRNLVDNAVKYTPSGGSVHIRARELDGNLQLAVEDTGIGIPQGEVDRIFERFYRVDRARSRRLGGTGLGLAIVDEIVRAHGGKIAVDTQLGRGSTFTVSLPVAVEAEADEQTR